MPNQTHNDTHTPIERPYASHFMMASILTCILLIASAFIYWPTTVSALRVWMNTETFKHCFFVIPIVLFLLWDKKEIFKDIPAIPFLPALILTPFIGAGWILAHIASANIGEHLMLVAFFQTIILTILGYRLYWAFLFPFSFLWFLVPFGEYFIPMLQNITTWFSLLFLTLVKIPYYNDGVFITVPNGNFEVAEACAGLRFLIATIVLGFLFAYLFYKSTLRRLLFIALSFIIPIVANGIRAFGIIFIAYMTNNEYAVGVDHLVYGWFFFAFVLALLIGTGLLFREDTKKEEKDNFTIYAQEKPKVLTPATTKQFLLAALLALVLVTLPRLYGHHMDQITLKDTSQFSTQKLAAKAPLTEVTCPSNWPTLFEGASMLSNCFMLDSQMIQVKIAYYPHQKEDKSLLSFSNRFYDAIDSSWKKTIDHSFSQNEKMIPFDIQTYDTKEGDKTIAHSYWINGIFTTSRFKVKMNQVISQFKYGHQTGFILMIQIPNDTINTENSIEFLEKALQGLPDFNDLFTKVATSNSSQPQ